MEYKLRRNLLIFALLVAVSLLVVMSIILFGGGTGSDSKKIIGTWKEIGSDKAQIEFLEDGSYSEISDVPLLSYKGDSQLTGTYKFEGDGIVKLYPSDEPGSVWYYRYIVTDNFLSLENTNKYEDKRTYSKR
ncbi:MAG: hypothetical protein J5715_05005 [Clostridiales bacterium]|nr:hypothetical protein [Clostridiales bacterium]MBO4579491.1 hypothetical protein [Clostridiales bacterium]